MNIKEVLIDARGHIAAIRSLLKDGECADHRFAALETLILGVIRRDPSKSYAGVLADIYRSLTPDKLIRLRIKGRFVSARLHVQHMQMHAENLFRASLTDNQVPQDLNLLARESCALLEHTDCLAREITMIEIASPGQSRAQILEEILPGLTDDKIDEILSILRQ
jgi:hypothetical protein